MQWSNSDAQWGWITILSHWLTAAAVTGLFGLGLWMTGLDYYDAWYTQAPHLHKSIGILLFGLTLLRLGWRLFNSNPQPLATHSAFERKAAYTAHIALYLLLVSVMLSGYLISTADGRAIEVFNWFEIPATLQGIERQEDLAGDIHLALAIALIALATLHAGAAIKHHVVDKDQTLRRMLGLSS